MRLSSRFALCVAVLVPLLVLLAGLLVLHLASHDLRAERDRQLTVRLRALTPLATQYAQRTRLRPAAPTDQAEQRLAQAAFDGGALLRPQRGEPVVIGLVPAALPATLPAGGGPATFVHDGVAWRFAAADLGTRGRAGRIWVFEPEDRLAERIDLLRHRLALATLAAAVAGAAAGLALGRFAVRPLSVLHRQARALTRHPGRLTTTSKVTEIDELAHLINESLDRRDAAVAAARAFAASAAHELRTPLTSMSANVDLLAHPDLAAADRAEIVADLAAEHARMQRLITMLRQLARGELLDPAAFTHCDLAELVDAAAEDARRRHPHATIDVRQHGEVFVRGWPEGLRLVADNLLDNAAVHGRDGTGRAVIEVRLEPGLLAVSDTGPGIPPEHREAVFERFHRGPGSPGSGLGLTLIRQQAALHGGTVTVAATPAGTRVELRLPPAPAGPRP
ncbi:sensor histidine kinase [Actinomadura craniellae]|uniref:histidine kinase n=1 Tax=Actinomadura craniellae TaxID=2231787 RepID=A0A365GXE6_9ACTN|nr:HAMP domain-containing sensor histidine kinase [Actinomadura craniellae]RAY11509.1 sensor histidine kinase [Actinomadura craniellae]